LFLYLHGFRSDSKSYKAGLFKGHFKDKILIPDYPIEPENAIPHLKKIIEENGIKGMIASSLGGYYATYLSEMYEMKTILINPSVKPYETTRKYLGENTKFNSKKFEWKESHLHRLAELKVEEPKPNNYLIFLQTADDVLDYKVALNFYKGCKMIIEEGGSHKFEGLDNHLDIITSFLNH